VGETLEALLDEEHKNKASFPAEHDESLRPWFAERFVLAVDAG
jgi:hypothetical protein